MQVRSFSFDLSLTLSIVFERKCGRFFYLNFNFKFLFNFSSSSRHQELPRPYDQPQRNDKVTWREEYFRDDNFHYLEISECSNGPCCSLSSAVALYIFTVKLDFQAAITVG